MKQIFPLLLLVLLSCNIDNTKNTETIKQNAGEINAIKNILINQQKCWNNGDIDGFMEGYWNSEELIFTSLNHKPIYGWNNNLKRYKNSYQTKSTMGELQFEILNLNLISKTTATLKGKWKLIREEDLPNGLFWIDLRKFDNNWLITKDSTISFELSTNL